MAFPNVNIHLTSDQHRMLDIYTAQYRQTTDHINQLYRYLDDIRSNINMVMFSNNSNTNSNANYNRNRNRRTTRENDNIFYDYNNPINRDIYLERLAGYQNFGHRIRNTNTNANANTNANTNANANANTNSNIYGTSDITADISGLLSSFLNSNVIVRPTNQQIENASRLVSYNEIRNPNSETCPISLERFNPSDQVRQINHCGHIFLPSEFNEWFQSNVRCPVCRYDIRNNQANIINTASVTGPTGVTRDTGVSEIGPSGPCGYSRSEAAQGAAQGVTAGVAQGALGAPGTISNENISNVNVVRNPQTNIVDQVSFDISGNTITNDIVNTLTNRLFETLFNPSGASNNASDYFVYDPSNNILMYETIFPPSNNDNNNNNNNNNNNSSNTRPHR